MPTRRGGAGRGEPLRPRQQWVHDPSASEGGRVMKEFLVEIVTTIPDGTTPAEVDALRAAEAVRAKELAATGHLGRLWRPVGELRSIGLWRADNEGALYKDV